MNPVPSIDTLAALAGMALLLAGVLLLRRSWLGTPGAGRRLVLAGWGLLLAGLAIFVCGWGGKLGTAFGLLAFSVVAYGVVAAGVEFRGARRREPLRRALEPEERRTNWTRGIAKAFLAIVLAGVASIGLGLAFAIGMPFGPHDRIVIGGLLVPLLWGAGMAWTLCDARLLRATLVLLAASAFGYGVAFLPGLLA